MIRKPAAILFVLSLAVLALALVPAAGLAAKGGKAAGGGGGKPGGGGGSSLTLVALDPDDGGANYGEQVTFQVSTTATDKPLVRLNCYQGSLVYTHSAGFYPGYPWPSAQIFTLSSTAWTGGAAQCTAELYMSDRRGGFKTLLTTPVSVYA